MKAGQHIKKAVDIWDELDLSNQPTQLDRIEADIAEIKAGMAQLLAPKKKPVARSSQVKYAEAFEEIWKNYPKRKGGNPKKKAYAAYCARRKEDLAYNMFYYAVLNYSDFCDTTEKTGTEWVMQTATFFGPDRPYLDDWTLPKVKPSEDPNKQHHPTYDPKAKVEVAPGADRDLT